MPTAVDPEARAARNAKRQQDAVKAQREFATENQRVAENTARLRALRLAKEAKDEAERAAAPPKVVKKKKKVAKAIAVDKLNASNDD